MIPTGREQFAYLQVERPVLSGADEFLIKAQHLGKRVLGELFRTAITEFTVTEGDSAEIEPSYKEIPIPENRLKLEKPEDLKLILLHRRALAEHSSRYSFSYNAGRFGAVRKPVYPPSVEQHPTHYKPSDLYDQLDQISLDCGVNPDRLVVMCDRVAIVRDDGPEEVLALYPQLNTTAQQVIHTQVRVAEKRLEQQSRRLAELRKSSTTGAIRLGSIPAAANENNNQLLLDELTELLPLRLVIGGVSAARSKEARSKSW